MPKRANREVTAERLAEMLHEIHGACNYPSCADNFTLLWPDRVRIAPQLTTGTITAPNMVTYEVCSTCYYVLMATALGVPPREYYNRGCDRVTQDRAESAIGYRWFRDYTYTPNERAALDIVDRAAAVNDITTNHRSDCDPSYLGTPSMMDRVCYPHRKIYFVDNPDR